MFPSPHIVDIVGRLGFDWVLIDCEHGSISLESVELMVMAAEAAGVTPIARPPVNSFESIGQLMDRGVMGVQVPHVNTADQARSAVEAVKYHPIGERGLAAGVRSASYGYGMSMAEYAERSNNETLVCVQLEESEAVENVDEIALVEGVDVLFVGPSDLSSRSDTRDARTRRSCGTRWTGCSVQSWLRGRYPALRAILRRHGDT